MVQAEISNPQKHRDHGWTITFIILAIIIVSGVFYAGGVIPQVNKLYFLPNTFGIPVEKSHKQGGGIQIDNVQFITVSPNPTSPQIPSPGVTLPPNPTNTSTPTPTAPPPLACHHDDGHLIAPSNSDMGAISCSCDAWIVECENQLCKRLYRQNTGMYYSCDVLMTPGDRRFPDIWCSSPSITQDGDGIYCVGKPIIYLYPTKPTFVNVRIRTIGTIFVSDPLYPENGWKNVLAYPDGTLLYNEKSYKELFYETNVDTITAPSTGIVVKKSEIKKTLESITYQLGLTEYEQSEFMSYWMDRLSPLPQPYILISILEPDAKKIIDTVEISPEPDTRIEFIAYFKPLSKPISIPKLQLPERPIRHGFTMVEWGGTIDTYNPLRHTLIH